MSYNSRAESALVESIKQSRKLPRPKGFTQNISNVTKGEEALDDEDRRINNERLTLPIPPSSETDADTSLVKSLEVNVPKFDKTRQFPGLIAQKIAKKDRHFKAIDDFAIFLDKLAENFEQDVLRFSRELKEKIEIVDADLQSTYNTFLDDKYLIVQSEQTLIDKLDVVKGVVSSRCDINDAFGNNLDQLEIKRAEIVGKELKDLVDRLISIAHQLPNEIERIVESETFDLNSVLTINRKAHAQLINILKKTQVEVEIETLQRWEDCRNRWRQLRHEKAFKDFSSDMLSDRFSDPEDRRSFMKETCDKQKERHEVRYANIKTLSNLNFSNITVDAVVSVQKNFTSLAEEEIAAVQSCYNGLQERRGKLSVNAEARVEVLRKELHLYGALFKEPDFISVINQLKCSLDDPNLAELWRLGGGLKTEFQYLCSDLCSEEIVYDRHVISVKERFELICSSFNLVEILEKRGRASQLDKVRNLISKMRGVAKTEVAAVLSSLLPELEEIANVEEVPVVFRKVIHDCIVEMNAEIDKVKLNSGGSAVAGNTTTIKSSTAKSANGRTANNKSGKGSKSGKSGATMQDKQNFVDPISVKQWSRKLGVLYYGSDLPKETQQCCLNGLAGSIQQLECNRLIDSSISTNCPIYLIRIERKYKKLIDAIATFLETQASYVATCLTNIGEFYLLIAKCMEEHRSTQKSLDDRSADELWDLSEDFRFEKEERELVFDEACNKIRRSITYEELQDFFDDVLKILDDIQESYRIYHSKGCFAADKHPLTLADEFKTTLLSVSKFFDMKPDHNHPILANFNRIFDTAILKNQKFFDIDPAAAGVAPREIPVVDPDAKEVDDAENEEEQVEQNEINEVNEAPKKQKNLETYISPNKKKDDVGGHNIYNTDATVSSGNSDTSNASYGGNFILTMSLDKVVSRLMVEVASKDDLEVGKIFDKSEEKEIPNIELHEKYPWLRIETTVIPLGQEEFEKIHEDDREEYVESLSKMFVEMPEPEPIQGEDESIEPNKLYEWSKSLVVSYKERKTLEADNDYIRNHPPLHVHKHDLPTPWVLPLTITASDLSNLLFGMRESLVVELEIEANNRIKDSEIKSLHHKEVFTDQLEDRLRTHWPRRGRIETQVKQPREAELLGHEEKTWRYIQSIQQRMTDTQSKFFEINGTGLEACKTFVTDMDDLIQSLTSEKFKNLAVLQGVDMRARSQTLTFNSSSLSFISTLSKICEEDTAAIINYAMEFRKICPPQTPGVEGGYSEKEITEIEGLVVGQCEEIKIVSGEWRQTIDELSKLQKQSVLRHHEFVKVYESVAQNLAMSEGLGQKYGAPRRRAQERLRTEVSRDEKKAGLIDEMLAKMEFICSELKLKEEKEIIIDEDNDSNLNLNGRIDLDSLHTSWKLICNTQIALKHRTSYLCVIDKPLPELELKWIVNDRIPANVVEDDADLDIDNDTSKENSVQTSPKFTLQEVFADVDVSCRKETRELYESEGLGSVLGDSGVPESLETWLVESKEKILGRHGYREKAWKRMYAQTERFEILLARKSSVAKSTLAENEDEDDEDEKMDDNGSNLNHLGAPATCMKFLTSAFIQYFKNDVEVKEKKFIGFLKNLEQGREKHERLLRPRLGSPDAVDELEELDTMELKRSKETTDLLLKFRSDLIRDLALHSKEFIEDISVCCSGLVALIDSSTRQEVLQCPPDTAVPFKRMTLKRMRKAQRLREEIANGAEDRSLKRVWPSIPLNNLLLIVKEVESLVQPREEKKVEAVVSAPVATKGKKVKEDPAVVAAALAKAEADALEAKNPSLISSDWQTKAAAASAVTGGVSTAHRVLMVERDEMVAKYCRALQVAFDDVKNKYGSLLQHESSWNERWKRQVKMLRKGNL